MEPFNPIGLPAAPAQKLLPPGAVTVFTPGKGFTVTVAIAVQPPTGIVYVMSAVPADTPPITPDIELAVATAVLPLLHAPPVVASLSVVVCPWHALAVPVIGDGEV